MHERFINRELSVLDFQNRVLALALDPTLPLLERLKFVAIVSQNLDEFYQVRVSGLMNQHRSSATIRSVDGLSAAEQLHLISQKIASISSTIDELFTEQIRPALEKEQIAIVSWADLDGTARLELDRRFEDDIFPVLTPLAVDPSHPFPYISNLSLNLGVMVSNPPATNHGFARIKIPQVLPRFITLSDGKRLVPLEQVVAAHLPRLFAGLTVAAHFPFRITRNADFAVEEDEADDLLEAMESVLRVRQLSAAAVRLEVGPEATSEVVAMLLRELHLTKRDVTVRTAPLDLGSLFTLCELDRPDLKLDTQVPTTQARLAMSGGKKADFFAAMNQGDILVHHPYESFATSTAAFLEQAVADPDVLAIKQTLYRTDAADDPAIGGEFAVVELLRQAARSGTQVVVLVELQARFDEAANITWARMLEDAGAHVVYGVSGLKTHSKILIVVRREAGSLRRYAHIGTGNYNPKTAAIYEDLGLFTADPAIGADLSELFNTLTGYGSGAGYEKLLVAPTTLRHQTCDRIRTEAAAGSEGSIVFKVNHLADPEIVNELYAASQAGCEVQLIVRGICSLRPGVPGLSDNITVRSIVGRFLEHSRVYRFGQPGKNAVYYLGSADMMTRNLNRRVETIVPVVDPQLQGRIETMLNVLLSDDLLAWRLNPDATWTKNPTVNGVDSHATLATEAIARQNGLVP